MVCLEDVYFGTIPDAEASSTGAVGMILANDDENYYDFIACPHALPTSQVNYIDSQYIYSYIKNEKERWFFRLNRGRLQYIKD